MTFKVPCPFLNHLFGMKELKKLWKKTFKLFTNCGTVVSEDRTFAQLCSGWQSPYVLGHKDIRA